MSDDLTPQQRAFLQQMNTPGSVLYGVFAWMSDSMMLARLRPVFADLFALSVEQQCVVEDRDNGTCRDIYPADRDVWCTPCAIHDLADRVNAVAKP